MAMSANGHVQQQLDAGNPWYVLPQLDTLTDPWVRSVYENRWRFIGNALHRGHGDGTRLRVLDAGCGDGANLVFLVAQPDLEITAADYNPLRLARVRERFPGVAVRTLDLCACPPTDERFDIILLSHVLEHLKQDVAALSYLRDLLAPHGRLLVAVPNEGCLLAWLRNHVFERSILTTTDHVHFYRDGMLRRRIRAAGLEIEALQRYGAFLPTSGLFERFTGTEQGREKLAEFGRRFPSQCGELFYSLVAAKSTP
jgi:2-polyprenyl-3-methyl-5-hydroxy-6-metoxy-1,4-benzoquinol methylase